MAPDPKIKELYEEVLRPLLIEEFHKGIKEKVNAIKEYNEKEKYNIFQEITMQHPSIPTKYLCAELVLSENLTPEEHIKEIQDFIEKYPGYKFRINSGAVSSFFGDNYSGKMTLMGYKEKTNEEILKEERAYNIQKQKYDEWYAQQQRSKYFNPEKEMIISKEEYERLKRS